MIRPLAYVAEQDLATYAEAKAFPIIPCALCGSQVNLQRKVIGEMLRQWEKQFPGRIESILRALTDVSPSHLLDRKLFDFLEMKSSSRPKNIEDFKELGEPQFAAAFSE